VIDYSLWLSPLVAAVDAIAADVAVCGVLDDDDDDGDDDDNDFRPLCPELQSDFHGCRAPSWIVKATRFGRYSGGGGGGGLGGSLGRAGRQLIMKKAAAASTEGGGKAQQLQQDTNNNNASSNEGPDRLHRPVRRVMYWLCGLSKCKEAGGEVVEANPNFCHPLPHTWMSGQEERWLILSQVLGMHNVSGAASGGFGADGDPLLAFPPVLRAPGLVLRYIALLNVPSSNTMRNTGASGAVVLKPVTTARPGSSNSTTAAVAAIADDRGDDDEEGEARLLAAAAAASAADDGRSSIDLSTLEFDLLLATFAIVSACPPGASPLWADEECTKAGTPPPPPDLRRVAVAAWAASSLSTCTELAQLLHLCNDWPTPAAFFNGLVFAHLWDEYVTKPQQQQAGGGGGGGGGGGSGVQSAVQSLPLRDGFSAMPAPAPSFWVDSVVPPNLALAEEHIYRKMRNAVLCVLDDSLLKSHQPRHCAEAADGVGISGSDGSSSSSSGGGGNNNPVLPLLPAPMLPTGAAASQAAAETALPIEAYRKEILLAVEANQVVCIQGETGCGKSTCVPQVLAIVSLLLCLLLPLSLSLPPSLSLSLSLPSSSLFAL
jgi:hypothetical protein